MASGPITSWEIDGETVETVSDFIFLGSKITADGDCSHEIKRWERLKAGGEGLTQDVMVGRHNQLNGHEFEQTPGDGEGQGSFVCHSPWGCRELNLT